MSVFSLARRACAIALSALLLPCAHAAPTQIQDVLGREVKLELPARRVMLGFYVEDWFAIAGERGFDSLVAMSKGWFVKSRPVVWEQYAAARPTLRDVIDVGNVQDQTFSIEKVLAARPDVVILAEWQFKALASEVSRLEAAGIAVVVIDYNAQTVERHLASTRVLGRLSGENARAERIADDYRRTVDGLRQRITQARLPRPRVYVELGDKGPAEHSYTYGRNMWGAMAELLGGDNIAAPYVKDWGSIHPEQLLAARPQVVLIAGYESVSRPDAMQMGFGIGTAEARRRLQGYTQRHGWAALPAVQDGRVHGVYHGATRSVLDAALLQYMAKALYPTVFAELDPEATYREFYRRYLPIQPQGTFMLAWR